MKSELMRTVLTAVLFALLAAGCASKSTKMKLEDMAENRLLQRPEALMNWLRNCQESCQSPDNQIAGQLYEGYQELMTLGQETPDYRKWNSDQKKRAVQAKLNVRRAFSNILRQKDSRDLLVVAYRALAERDAFYLETDDEFARMIKESVSRLKSKTETATTGWYLQSLTEKQTLATLQDLVECLKISPDDVDCKMDYAHWGKVYERPWCVQEKISDFGSLVLKPVSSGIGVKNSMKPVSFKKTDLEDVYFDSEQLDSDILGITLSAKAMGQLQGLQQKQSQKMSTEESAGALSQQWDLGILFHGQKIPVGMARINESSRRVAVDFPRGKAGEDFFKRLCPAPEQNKLPSNLILK